MRGFESEGIIYGIIMQTMKSPVRQSEMSMKIILKHDIIAMMAEVKASKLWWHLYFLVDYPKSYLISG